MKRSRPELESVTEQKLRKAVISVGGECWKMTAFTGCPDRLVLMPGGKACFVETKQKGKKPGPLQAYVHRQIRKLGFRVVIIDDQAGIDQFIKSLS